MSAFSEWAKTTKRVWDEGNLKPGGTTERLWKEAGTYVTKKYNEILEVQ